MKVSKELLERFQEFKVKILTATGRSILNSTIQFFSANKKGEPSPEASGLLITLEDRFFMVTAAHVIAENYNDLFIILRDKELRLGGKLHYTPLPESGKREDDKLDIAIMELEDSVVADLIQSYRFIGLDNIEIDHKVEEFQPYLSVGYPITKTKIVWGKAEISSEPFLYQTEPDITFDYKESGFSPQTHIAVKFDGKVTSSNNPIVHKAPKMNGVSGSGIWYLKDFGTPKTLKSKQLIGIVIEKINKPNNQVLVATRIDFITEFIKQKFDIEFPKPKKLKVNIK